MRFGLRLIVSAGLLATAFLAGLWIRKPAELARNPVRQPLYYIDPMHPAYKSSRPGIAPDCGMQLEPVYAENAGAAAETGGSIPGTVRISVDKQQFIGLKKEKVRRASGTHTLQVLGRVAADESHTYQIAALADGVVRTVSPYVAGSVVHKDDLLATYFVYLRDVYNAIQQYFVAMGAVGQGAAASKDASLIDASKAQVRLTEELLQAYGISETQIRELARTRQITRDIEFRSPVTGVVLSRTAFPGQKVDRGTELYRIADLSQVWVIANLGDNDSSLVGRSPAVRVHYQGRSWHASVADVRELDAASRTMKVRLAVANTDFYLRPDQFVDVEFDVREPEKLSIPADALLDSGRRKIVFVSTGEGSFEPREVVPGLRYGERVQIISGLEEGESVVVSGLFLLDSESRLRMNAPTETRSAKGSVSRITDPTCGMEISSLNTGWASEYEGKTYRFCSKGCKEKFDEKQSHLVARQSRTSVKDAR